MLKETVTRLVTGSLDKFYTGIKPDIICDTPKNTGYGDLSINTAMQLAKPMGKSPREIAKNIIDNIEIDSNIIEKIEIAGPGFINFTFNRNFICSSLAEVLNAGTEYGRQEIGKAQKVNVEYVSANPTGLLHLGHGRNAVIGDTVANLYNWLGYEVTRVYYLCR